VSQFASFFDYSGDGDRPELVFLGDRGEEDWARLLRFAERRRIRAGETLIREGEIDRSLYLLSEGRLEVLLGDALRLAVIEPGSVVGELAFLDGQPRSATIRALEDGEFVRLGFEGFEVLAAHYPELGRAILLDLARIVAIRLRDTNEALARATR
jgi:CRP-like cAMP-binding protein